MKLWRSTPTAKSIIILKVSYFVKKIFSPISGVKKKFLWESAISFSDVIQISFFEQLVDTHTLVLPDVYFYVCLECSVRHTQ